MNFIWCYTTKQKIMELHEFIRVMYKDLNDFKEHWVEEQKKQGKEIYPANLSKGDWFEQFLAYETKNI